MIHVFTSAAVNYLPKVCLLVDSIKKFHPELKVHLALPDIKPAWLHADLISVDSIITINDLDIPGIKSSWIFKHTLIELSTAIKPFVVKKLFSNTGCKGVIYFDPDIVLFSRLDDLINFLDKFSILLTPHQTIPEDNFEAILDNEICSLKYGVYNLGFIAIKNDTIGNRFVDWWSDRLYHFCKEGLNDGLWTDQKWINLVPAFFDGVKILRSSRFNVAAWNITTRKMEGSIESGIRINGEPLGFYHFSGWDSGAHVIMAMKYARKNESLIELIQWYKKNIDKNSNFPKSEWGYAYFDNGEKITSEHRLIYRMRTDLQDAYPNPFNVVVNGNCYYNWYKWRAHIEHPEIVSKGVISPNISSRYNHNWSLIVKKVKMSLMDYRYGVRLLLRLFNIVKKKGIEGVISRLRGGMNDQI